MRGCPATILLEHGDVERRATLLCALLTLALIGCSTVRVTEQVEGVVLLDGQPLPDIRVNFQPRGSDRRECGIGSYGLTDANGRFVLRFVDDDSLGALVGMHTVTLSDERAEDDADAVGPTSGCSTRLPESYFERPLTFHIKGGQKNEPRFELMSQ